MTIYKLLMKTSLKVIFCSLVGFCALLSFNSELERFYIKHQNYCHPRNVNISVDDILCMTPKTYLKEFKNPCWRQNGTKLECLPYFMLIGMDKSGSTDLFDRIIKHPQILGNGKVNIGPGDNKETMWWSWLRYGYWLNRNIPRETFRDYIRYFDKPAQIIDTENNSNGFHYLITGDGTPMDMWDFRGWQQIPQNFNKSEPEILTPHLIRHLRPEMKFIIILRNPVERLYSDYFFLGLGKPDNIEFDNAVNSSLEILHSCTNIYSLRKCLYDKNMHLKWNYLTRIHLGFYSVYLKEWFNVFPRHQFLIIRTEDYSKNTFEYMSKVFNFLEADTLDLQQMNMSGILSTNRKHKTRVKEKVDPMSNITRELLTNLYRPFNQELAGMLEDRRFLWNDDYL